MNEGEWSVMTSETDTTFTVQQSIKETQMPHKVYLATKRIFDLICASLGLIIFFPIFLIVALAIKISDGGPVIHARICIGQYSRPYKMYKFRTMVVDADNLERWLSPEQREEYRIACKLDDDPRITTVGKFLRKTSIDELPQLVSVLCNNMSLIGPRPVVAHEADAYGEKKSTLLSVKPGITGWWQVKARSSIPYLSDEAKALQLYYAEHSSLVLDIEILLMTVAVVLKGNGAK